MSTCFWASGIVSKDTVSTILVSDVNVPCSTLDGISDDDDMDGADVASDRSRNLDNSEKEDGPPP